MKLFIKKISSRIDHKKTLSNVKKNFALLIFIYSSCPTAMSSNDDHPYWIYLFPTLTIFFYRQRRLKTKGKSIIDGRARVAAKYQQRYLPSSPIIGLTTPLPLSSFPPPCLPLPSVLFLSVSTPQSLKQYFLSEKLGFLQWWSDIHSCLFQL